MKQRKHLQVLAFLHGRILFSLGTPLFLSQVLLPAVNKRVKR